MITTRWIDGPTAAQEDWDAMEAALASRGWMSLNRATSRILVAEKDGETAFIVFQTLPYCGPLYVPKSMRGTGIAEELTKQMLDFLHAHNARGWATAAESRHAEKLCEAHGMTKMEVPVYIMPLPGGLEI